MEIRGIGKIVRPHELEPSKFYMQAALYGQDRPAMFLCFSTGKMIDDTPETQALYFNFNDETDMIVSSLPDHDLLIEIPDVVIRIDRQSINGTSRTMGLRPGMMIAYDGGCAAMVSTGEFRGAYLIDIPRAKLIQEGRPDNWVSFTRWQIIIDEKTEGEAVIASFDAVKPATN